MTSRASSVLARVALVALSGCSSADTTQSANDAGPGDYAGSPFGGTPQTIPGTIELARYDLGGEGVAFHDTSMPPGAFNKCGVTRSDAVNLACTGGLDLAFPACTAETAGEVYLGYLGSGEWFK